MTEEITHICPSLLIECKGESGYSNRALQELFNGEDVSEFLPYGRFDENDTMRSFIDNSKRISLSGVQIKYSTVLDEGTLRLTMAEEQGGYILKPTPNNIRYKDFCPANEHLTMQIAAQVYDITTAPNALCFFKDGSAAYFIRRFDILDGKKLLKEDFASLAGLTNKNGGSDYKYSNLSYEGCAELIDKYSSVPKVDKMRFFELLLFNFVYCNGDAHLKNFSLLEDINGKFRLSPAYDLLNTHIHVDDNIFALDKGLFNNPKKEYFGVSSAVTGKTFQAFGEIIDLPTNLVSGLLDKYCTIHESIDRLIDNSFLSDNLKKNYKQMYKSRIDSFLTIR